MYGVRVSSGGLIRNNSLVGQFVLLIVYLVLFTELVIYKRETDNLVGAEHLTVILRTRVVYAPLFLICKS